jgi:hypothetical protein
MGPNDYLIGAHWAEFIQMIIITSEKSHMIAGATRAAQYHHERFKLALNMDESPRERAGPSPHTPLLPSKLVTSSLSSHMGLPAPKDNDLRNECNRDNDGMQ